MIFEHPAEAAGRTKEEHHCDVCRFPSKGTCRDFGQQNNACSIAASRLYPAERACHPHQGWIDNTQEETCSRAQVIKSNQLTFRAYEEVYRVCDK
jgi:hypothetical protein